ncbi:hypothetical protein ANO11243_097270 [Dothideomycetidae sp. 11243]|nr:hypothetical protein ANO11243_097270 [fungal sp. No.11243]
MVATISDDFLTKVKSCQSWISKLDQANIGDLNARERIDLMDAWQTLSEIATVTADAKACPPGWQLVEDLLLLLSEAAKERPSKRFLRSSRHIHVRTATTQERKVRLTLPSGRLHPLYIAQGCRGDTHAGQDVRECVEAEGIDGGPMGGKREEQGRAAEGGRLLGLLLQRADTPNPDQRPRPVRH